MKALLLALMMALVLAASQSNALTCDSSSYSFHGKKIESLVERYDTMLENLARSQDPIADLNTFLKKDGLPIFFSIPNDMKELKGDYVKPADGFGPQGAFFVKVLRPPVKDANLDKVFEVAGKDAKKALHTWMAPDNNSNPAGIQGDELFVGITFPAFCKENLSHEAVLAIKPNGQVRITAGSPEEGQDLADCTATKALFKDSAYGACQSFTDKKSKKKHILLFQRPMT